MRRLLATAVILTSCFLVPVGAADKEKPKDSEKAAATRKALEAKISVDWKDDRMSDVAEELSKKISEASKTKVVVRVDSLVSGLTQNEKVTFSAKDKPASEVLDAFCKKQERGYIVISGSYPATKPKYPAKTSDGIIILTKGSERGYPESK